MVCTKCGIDKQDDSFYRKVKRCKDCVAKHKANYQKANPELRKKWKRAAANKKRDLVRAAKNVPCTDCGVSYPYWVMDLDHCRGTKDFNLGNYAKYGLEKVKKEIAKCDPVCSNCHRNRTAKDLGLSLPMD